VQFGWKEDWVSFVLADLLDIALIFHVGELLVLLVLLLCFVVPIVVVICVYACIGVEDAAPQFRS